MKSFKQIIALLLCIAMMVCMLASCEPGPQGEKGDKGATGATIQKVEFDAQGRLVITLTDGTVLPAVEMPKPEGTDGLEYYPLPDGTFGVSAGTTKYLEEIEIPATYNGKAVTKILENAFQGASNLKKITIPDSVMDIGSSAFIGCYSLTSITIPDSVTSIGNSAFSGCTNLKSVTIPDSVTSIGYYAFGGCTSLTSIEFAENSQLTSIGVLAFYACTSLTSITIPDSVTSIGSQAFDDCTSLETVYYGGTASEWSEIMIGSYNSYLTSATRYYYSETEPATTGNWWHYVDGVPTVW